MKNIKIKKVSVFERMDSNNVRTARKYHTIFFHAQNRVYIFKNKKKMVAFLSDFEKETDAFLLLFNQSIADLYFLFRQSWAVYAGRQIADDFREIDQLLDDLTRKECSFYCVENNISRLVHAASSIVSALKKSAMKNKNYALSHIAGAFGRRIEKSTNEILNFGKSGKWAAYGEKYTPKKLY